MNDRLEAIRSEKNRQGLSDTQLADMCDLSHSTVSRAFSGKTEPSEYTLNAMETALGTGSAPPESADQEDMTLRLIDGQGGDILKFPIACGKNYGNKRKSGDMKTPEGVFSISEIVDASCWTHDFGDGKGEIAGAYGPFFIRLETPGHKGIGIHGTHKPESIGTRDTEGCIRLHLSFAAFCTKKS